MRNSRILSTTIFTLVILVTGVGADTGMPTSVFDQQLVQLRSDYSLYSEKQLQTAGEGAITDSGGKAKHFSPGKAFAMSLLVPGLGQYYTGNKMKAAGFFALDVTSWVLHFKYRSDGNTLTREFQAYQQTYWAQSRYEDYLDSAYGYRDDDSINATEVSHHLPDTRTQQYYEMTGKYDQFAWGWDDALLGGSSLYELVTVPPAVGVNVPTSEHRTVYETKRHNANRKFDAADKWLIVSLANHVISAFEAMIAARHKNKNISGSGEFGRVTVRADLRSFATRHDTPYVRCSYAF
jgi:hypothetical protein